VRDRVIIGSRGSRLALWQSNHIAELLRDAAPGLAVEIQVISTRGDRILDKPLPQIGGKGVFTEELERALRDESTDLAVHSLKDLPVQEPDGLTIGAIPKRANPLDALVARDVKSLAELPEGARVGTSSLRRKAQLLLRKPPDTSPNLDIVDLRGNVETRIAKVLEKRELDAAVLACAGLERLGLQDVISEVLQPEVMLPAPGQGALAIQCRDDDEGLLELLAALDHSETRAEVGAERALLQGLGGGCSAPIGALVRSGNDSVGVWCGVFGPPGMKSVTMATARNNAKPPFDLDRMVAQMLESLRQRGAGEILGYYR
jgi:hydroxymethylbilane synthase